MLLAGLLTSSWLALSGLPPVDQVGNIHGTVIDDRGYFPLHGVTVNLTCTCALEPRSLKTSQSGEFEFFDLPPGQYTVEVYGGEGLLHYDYAITAGETRDIVLAIPRTRLPKKDTRNLLVYGGFSRNRQLLAAQLELAFGGVLFTGGALMVIGGIVETNKPQCEMGPNTCPDPPRRGVARGLIFGGALSATAGGLLLGLGAAHLNRYRLGATASRDGGGLTLTGRF